MSPQMKEFLLMLVASSLGRPGHCLDWGGWAWDVAALLGRRQEDPWSWTAGSGRARKPLGSQFESSGIEGGREVPVLEAKSFTNELFKSNWSHRQPFVLRGLATQWPAAQAWHWQQLVDPTGPYSNLGLARMLEAFFPPTGQPLAQDGALFLDGVISRSPLSEDCRMFDLTSQEGGRAEPGGVLGENYLPRLNEALRAVTAKAKSEGLLEPDFKAPESIHNYFIAGPAGSGGKLHVDPEAAAYWNALVHGRKRWMFLKPEDLGALAAGIHRANAEVLEDVLRLVEMGGRKLPKSPSKTALRKLLQKIPALKWFGSLLPLLRDAGINFPHQEVTVSAGDIVYGPPGLFHIVLSLDDSIGCSEQLVDEVNLARFVRNEEEDFDAAEAYLGCEALRATWPELLRPLDAFCVRAERELRDASTSQQDALGDQTGSSRTASQDEGAVASEL